MASIGSSAPETNDSPEAPAACTGLTRSVGVDVQLGVQMGVQGVAGGQLGGDGAGRGGGEALRLVESGQLGQLGVGLVSELPFLLLDQRALAVALAAHRHVLAQGHRHRAADQAGQSGSEDGAAVRGGPRHPDTMPATETIPSLAPSTPARSQFSRLVVPAACGSRACVGRPLSAAWT